MEKDDVDYKQKRANKPLEAEIYVMSPLKDSLDFNY